MIIIGCDFHPSTQTLAWKNPETGECGGHELRHDGEAQAFYRNLRGQVVRVGMEATGHARWFERWLAECGVELWVADPARVRAAATRKQKTDKRDAELLLELLSDGRLEKMRIHLPTPAGGIAVGHSFDVAVHALNLGVQTLPPLPEMREQSTELGG